MRDTLTVTGLLRVRIAQARERIACYEANANYPAARDELGLLQRHLQNLRTIEERSAART